MGRAGLAAWLLVFVALPVALLVAAEQAWDGNIFAVVLALGWFLFGFVMLPFSTGRPA